jgi:hypothetical protein
VRPSGREEDLSVDRLDTSWLPGRSGRSRLMRPSSPAPRTVATLIVVAAHLLAGLRLWAQNRYRSDQAVREILESADVVALNAVAHHLLASGTIEGQVAGESVSEIAGRPFAELWTVASYALLAL